jgi:hypothetical protein
MRNRPGIRRCSKSGCAERAVATLSYNYAEQIATLSHLQQYPEPHTYDLCQDHGERLIIPRGWKVITTELNQEPIFQEQDFSAIADAVRDVVTAEQIELPTSEISQPELRRRGHLRSL